MKISVISFFTRFFMAGNQSCCYSTFRGYWYKKTCFRRFFSSEHSAWWYIFEGVAVAYKHAFEQIAHTFFHRETLTFQVFGIHLLSHAAYNMTCITKIKLFVMQITFLVGERLQLRGQAGKEGLLHLNFGYFGRYHPLIFLLIEAKTLF